ncbi:MAG: hypothetical protein ABEJ69_02090 [Candidatus Nanohaloarchaea archaeon]
MGGAADVIPGSSPDLKDVSDSVESTLTKRLLATAVLTGTGIAGRVLLQHSPSVEPIVPLAVGIGFYHNWRHGASSGASGFFLSNFLVWGAQGPWTVFQVLGAGAAGATGGLFSRFSSSRTMFFASLVAATVMYELSVNLGSLVYGMGALNPAFLLAAVPFGMIHLTSSISFGAMIYGFKEQFNRFY